jgi:NIMA-interacting peptidyl-prolyl cis-trans isomerase 1
MSSQEVRVLHLLLKHLQSRNPISRRTGKQITQSKADALKELQKYEKELNSSDPVSETDFLKVAEKRSDCGSFQKGGDLGFFGRGMMQKPFEDATYALKVDELSGPESVNTGPLSSSTFKA